MANERRLISVCGECANYDWKKHKCTVCSCKESDPKNPFYDDCPLPKGVEVVFCKDCRHCTVEKLLCTHPRNRVFGTGINVFSEHFCSYGEMRCE